MLEGDHYWADMLAKMLAVQEALRAVGRELLRNRLRHCVAEASRTGGRPAEAAYDEVVDLMYRNAK